MASNRENEKLLQSWKEIAAYLNCDRRTCLRWEKQHGLPVHRISNSPKSPVFCYKHEIDEWLKKGVLGEFKQKNILVRKHHLKYLYFLPIIFVIVFLIFNILKFSDHPEPADFNISNSSLIILDKDGREIWNYDTGIEALVDEKFYRNRFQIKRFSNGARYKPMLIFKDLNSDGDKEILFTLYAQGEIDSGGLFCFNHKGALLWKLNPLSKVTYGRDLLTSYAYPDGFYTYDMNSDGQYQNILISNHTHYFPTRLLLIDNEGKILGEYWNSGRINDFVAIDLDDDGVKELIIGGINNEYNSGFLAVFDSRSIGGCSPQNDEYYICKEMEPGTQMCYLRFPRTDASIQKYEQEGAIEIDELPDKRILVRVGPGVHYEFDFNFQIKSIRFANEFDELHKTLKREGKVHSDIDEEYHRNLAQSILYYDGDNWISQPTVTSHKKGSEK